MGTGEVTEGDPQAEKMRIVQQNKEGEDAKTTDPLIREGIRGSEECAVDGTRTRGLRRDRPAL